MKAIVLDAPGDADAMQWREVSVAQPGPGEVLLRHTAIGVNFIDVYFRSGLYPWPSQTLTPGAEAAGVVEAVGEGVSDVKAGDRVAYVGRHGAYAEHRLIEADRLVVLPDTVSDEQAASGLLKGLTVHFLVNSTYAVQPGDTVLVHAAAGGVGLILGQWLASIGATAIGTVGTAEKAALAARSGYAHTILYRDEDFVAKVNEITGGKLCPVVYDSVGADTWRGSLKCLRKRGMFVNFGQSSGMITDFKLSDLAQNGSLSACRPVLFDYVETKEELRARAADLFDRIGRGSLTVKAGDRLPLADAAEAHRRLEGRRTSGSTILIP